MGKKSAPKAPDYTGAAVAQGEANKDSALQTAYLSNPNINTHLGSQTVDWSNGGGTIKYGANGLPYYDKGTGNQQATVTQTLSPTEQAKYDKGSALDIGLLNTAQGGLNRVDDMMGTQFDMSGLQNVQGVQGPAQGVQGPSTDGLAQLQGINTDNLDPYSTEASVGGLQQVTDAIRSRGDVDFADRRQALDNDLRIRGFTPGSEGFRREMQGLERQQNDYNQQALLAGGQEQSRINSYEQARRAQELNEQRTGSQVASSNRGQEFGERSTQAGYDQGESQRTFANQQDLQAAQGAERQRQIQEQAYLRQLPLNEINALRTGTQVNAPQFQQYTGAQVAPAPLFQAAQAQGNFDVANAQNRPDIAGGLFQLGGAALGGGMFGAGGLLGK